MPRLAWQAILYLGLVVVDGAALYWMGTGGLWVWVVAAVPVGYGAVWLEPQRKL